jgi:hypothetical protein
MTKLIRILSRPRILMLMFTALVLAVCFGALSCRQVSDVAGGVTLQGSDVNSCIHQCNLDAAADVQEEINRHEKAIKACGLDPGCRVREDQKFIRNLLQIEKGRLICINNCHHQGGASGGR